MHSSSSNENLAVESFTSPPFPDSPPDPAAPEAVETFDRPTTSHNLRPRSHPVRYSETRFQHEVGKPIIKRFQPSSRKSGGLTRTQEQKRQSILDPVEHSRQATSVSKSMQPFGSSPAQNSKPFTHSGQPKTPPEYLQRQKETKSRYSRTILKKKRLSNNGINAFVESPIYRQFCFSQSNILTTTTSFAYCTSSDFANPTGLDAAVTRHYSVL